MKPSELFELINGLSKYNNYDSGVLFDNGKEVKSILMALDYDESLCHFAQKKGHDTILIHHSIGQFYYTAYKGLINKISAIRELGFCEKKYERLVYEDMRSCFLQMRNANMIKMIPSFIETTKDKLSCIVTHHVPDYLAYQEIISIVKQTNSLACLRSKLCQLVEDFGMFPKNEAVSMFTNSTNYKVPFVDICFVSSASNTLQVQLLEDGVDLLVVTSTTNEVINYAYAHNRTILLLNHIPFDYFGMKLLKNKLKIFFPIDIMMYEE